MSTQVPFAAFAAALYWGISLKDAKQQGGSKARAMRKDCRCNNQLKVTGASMNDSDDR
jgi:hypothetical protein